MSLKDGGRSPGGVRRTLRVALVVSEIALASLLLVAAGLTLRSFQSVLNLPPGFQTKGILTASVALPGVAVSRTNPSILAAFDQIEEKLRSLPGVRAVGATTHLPLSGRDSRRGVGIEGRTPTPDAPTRAHPRAVTPGYFQAIGITLLAGRPFTAADSATAPKVAIVNDTMARRYWPGASPVGKRVRLGGTDDMDRRRRRRGGRQALGSRGGCEPRAVPAAAAIPVPRRDVRRGGRRRSRVARAGGARSRARDSIPICRSRA